MSDLVRRTSVAVLPAIAAVMLIGCGGDAPQDARSVDDTASATTQAADGDTWWHLALKAEPPISHLPGEGPGAIEGLSGIAIAPGDAFFALACADGAHLFDANWNPVGQCRTPGPATAVAIGDNMRIYVAEQQRVHVFNTEGERLDSWGAAGEDEGQLGLVTGLAIQGPNVWVADAGNTVIHRFATNGDWIADVGKRDPQTGERNIICPSPHLDVAVVDDRTIMFSNPGRWRIEWWDLNGERVRTWGRQGSGLAEFPGCCNPTNIALGPGGMLVTSEKGLTRVQLIDTDGRKVWLAGAEALSEGAESMDLAVDGQGIIYVADPVSGRVHAFSKPAD